MMVSPGSFPGILHCFRQLPGTPGEADESAPGVYIILESRDRPQTIDLNSRAETVRPATLVHAVLPIKAGEIYPNVITYVSRKNLHTINAMMSRAQIGSDHRDEDVRNAVWETNSPVYRDELSVEQGLLTLGSQIVIPEHTFRVELLDRISGI